MTELWPFLYGHTEILENLAVGQIGQLVKMFKLRPWAHFLADQPKSFFVDHIDTRSLGENHPWAYRGTVGRELKGGPNTHLWLTYAQKHTFV